MRPRAGGLDVLDEEKYLAYARIRTAYHPARSVITTLFPLSYTERPNVILSLLIFCLISSKTAFPISLR